MDEGACEAFGGRAAQGDSCEENCFGPGVEGEFQCKYQSREMRQETGHRHPELPHATGLY